MTAIRQSSAAVAGLAALALLAACDAKAPRDTAGQVVHLTAIKLDGPASFPLNLAAHFPEGGFGDATRTVRDNGLATIDTIGYRGVQVLHYQTFADGRILSPNDFASISSRREFERRLDLAQIPHTAAGAEIAPVRHPRYPSVGFTYVGPGPTAGTTCFLGRAAYGVRVRNSDTLGLDTADAVLTGGLCGGGLDPAPWVRLFNGFAATAP